MDTARSRAAVLSDDRGVAMIVVIALMVVLFALSTMVLFLVNNATRSEAIQEVRVKEVHLADAGINAYLYQLRRDPNYYATNPTLGPTTQDDGVWFVRAIPPTLSSPLTLRAEGRLASQAASKTVVATVRFPTFADYIFLSNSDINVGAGATIRGKVRTNRDLNNAGTITLASWASGTITGGGVFGSLLPASAVKKYPNQPVIDFARVRTDMDTIRTVALANSPSTAFPASGYSNGGYLIVLNGTRFTIDKVTGVQSGGMQVANAPQTYNIPPNGVIHVQDSVWVRGTYSMACTVAAARNIYIPADVVKANPNGSYALGLIADQNVIVPTEYSTISGTTTTTVNAAMLAQSGAIYGNLVSGVTKPSLHIRGSMAYNQYGYFASGDPASAGFTKRLYQYDSALENYPPPMYPQQRTGALRVNTWVEN